MTQLRARCYEKDFVYIRSELTDIRTNSFAKERKRQEEERKKPVNVRSIKKATK